MAVKNVRERNRVVKKTCQNGSKTSTLNKHRRRNIKPYRGQGR